MRRLDVLVSLLLATALLNGESLVQLRKRPKLEECEIKRLCKLEPIPKPTRNLPSENVWTCRAATTFCSGWGAASSFSSGEARHQPPWRTQVTKLLNGDDPEFQEISPMITTLRYDLDQKIKRLTDALATVGIASTELEKVRIALEGTALRH